MVYTLHPTFSPNKVTTTSGPSFALPNLFGWGTFNVTVTVHFKPGFGEVSRTPLVAEHMLCFDSAQSDTALRLPKMQLPKQALAKIAVGHQALRPVSTRVRKRDGTTYVEDRPR